MAPTTTMQSGWNAVRATVLPSRLRGGGQFLGLLVAPPLLIPTLDALGLSGRPDARGRFLFEIANRNILITEPETCIRFDRIQAIERYVSKSRCYTVSYTLSE
jgi:hypothetical protein